ncbi:hypothetical protein [Plantactinospora sp. KLBMP9567]|uniref:hypothetical protein n=1 Tax=Plantactinospora sp. KLBMP9567 TaxID=3085900 RepID=UPI0029815807|nr:hypothetical protein [Plantactinospora sp. KLBMP9567]MDW5326582.1 hypothetical protein [Plantactinospora sp. KLBMP9567]
MAGCSPPAASTTPCGCGTSPSRSVRPRSARSPGTPSGSTRWRSARTVVPLASGAADATLRLWHTGVEHAADRVCALAHPRITVAEWRRYLPDLPFQPPC